LSTLTKVLIVLLTVFSIFLCGIVVTYVANAEDQRARAEGFRGDLRAAERLRDDAQNDLAQATQEAENMRRGLEAQMSELQVALSNLQAQFDAVQRENTQLVQQVANMVAVVKQAETLQASQMQQEQAAEQQVVALQADRTRLDTELKETNQLLIDKMALLAQLETDKKQLIETNQELETRLNQYLRQYGKAAVAPKVVTPTRAIAQPAPSTAKDIALNGRVTAVDMKNALAEISIGAAAGVKQDMKFHVTRGEQFLCYIEILDVDADRAVGQLTVMQGTPRAGDVCATNL
jgi:myosin heavy subunit